MQLGVGLDCILCKINLFNLVLSQLTTIIHNNDTMKILIHGKFNNLLLVLQEIILENCTPWLLWNFIIIIM